MGESNAAEQPNRSKLARVLTAVVPLAGLAAVLVGSFIAWSSNANASFGWFAYAPLSNEPFSRSGMAFLTQGAQFGLAVAVAGLLVLAFWAGHALGRRAGIKNH
jgi:heme/copper-type cytochrome/quinol oxidase subunit 1